jgi:hypothetical protein
MSGKPAHLNTYHRCGAQEWELHQGSADDSWESSTEHVSDTSSVSADTDLDHDLVTNVQQVPQQHLDLQCIIAFLPQGEDRQLL